MTKTVVSVDIEDTVEQVEATMNSKSLSSVPVADSSGVIFGIISLKDIEAFRTAKKNPKVVRAWELCTYKPLQAKPNDSIAEVGHLMVKNNIHHVVVTENRIVKGIVSSLDLLREYLRQDSATAP